MIIQKEDISAHLQDYYWYDIPKVLDYRLQREVLIKQISRDFKEKASWFVTLTFHPKVSNDLYSRSEDIQMYLSCVNRVFLKTDARKRNHKLKVFVVFERSKLGGLHAHLLIEGSSGRMNKAEEKANLKWRWLKMDCSGSDKAIDIQEVYDVENLLSYMLKDYRSANDDSIDYMNSNIFDSRT